MLLSLVQVALPVTGSSAHLVKYLRFGMPSAPRKSIHYDIGRDDDTGKEKRDEDKEKDIYDKDWSSLPLDQSTASRTRDQPCCNAEVAGASRRVAEILQSADSKSWQEGVTGEASAAGQGSATDAPDTEWELYMCTKTNRRWWWNPRTEAAIWAE